jgi:activator of HSP90 ATPase
MITAFFQLCTGYSEFRDACVEIFTKRSAYDYAKICGKDADKEFVMETKNLRQTVTFNARAKDVYELLMDAEKHSAITGGDAVVISPKAGGKFNIGGYIEGANLELVPGRKIVQSWRYEDWPKGHYSKAIFDFKEENGKTKMTFTQAGIPAEFYDDIKQGWIDYYWAPMKEMLKK